MIMRLFILVYLNSGIYTIYNVNDNNNLKKLALIGIIYYFFQAFFLDTILWCYNFF
jgi:hypothetical protein